MSGQTFLTLHRLQRGLTLLELLLTLVIFSLVLGVFSQALFQIAQFERGFDRSTLAWQKHWSGGLGLEEWMDRLAMLPEIKDGDVKGSAREFVLPGMVDQQLQALLPLPTSGARQVQGLQRWTLTLRKTEAEPGAQAGGAGGVWGLWLQATSQLQSAAAPAPSVLLAQWAKEPRFEFVDLHGQASSVWPPGFGIAAAAGAQKGSFLNVQMLPQALRVVSLEGQLMHAWQLQGNSQRAAMLRGAGGSPLLGSSAIAGMYAN